MSDLRFIPLFLFGLILLIGFSAGASVGFDKAGITLLPGEVTMLNLTLDVAPDGLTGFAIDITISDSSVGEITAVSLPAWAEFSDIAGVPGPEVRIKAADLNDEAGKGTQGIPLATISVKGLSPGTTEIVLSDPRFDDDADKRITPALSNASFTVTTGASPLQPTTNVTAATTATTVGSALTAGSGGGGSGAGSSSSGTTIPATTSIPGTNGNHTSLDTTAEQTETPPLETTPGAPLTTRSGTTPPVTGSQGIPSITVPGVLLLIGAIILLGRKMR